MNTDPLTFRRAPDPAAGTRAHPRQYTGLEHITGLAVFIPDALRWVAAQISGSGRPNNCATLLR